MDDPNIGRVQAEASPSSRIEQEVRCAPQAALSPGPASDLRPPAERTWMVDEVDARALNLARRGVRYALAALWLIAALLQLQPRNFTTELINGTILSNAENQPQPILGSIVGAAHLLAPYPVELNLCIIAVQLTLGLGLLWPRTIKFALGGSVLWGLGIWWLGEGFGGLFSGEASLLVGAPGAALMYALIALILWPGARTHVRTVAGAGLVGEGVTRGAWALVWLGGAVLRVVPFWFPPTYALKTDLELGLDEEPRWIFHLNETLAHLAGRAGLAPVIALALVEACIGLGILLARGRRTVLVLGIGVSAIYWVTGQQFGELFTGAANDLSTAPLLILLALTLWPLRTSAQTGTRRSRNERSHLRPGLHETPLATLRSGTGGGGARIRSSS